MSQAPTNTRPAVAKSLDFWHEMIAKNDLGQLHTIVHPDAVFRSPMAHAAYSPAPALIMALSTVIQVFENFTYHRQLASDDGLNFVLEFSADIGDKKLRGVDLRNASTAGLSSPLPLAWVRARSSSCPLQMRMLK